MTEGIIKHAVPAIAEVGERRIITTIADERELGRESEIIFPVSVPIRMEFQDVQDQSTERESQ